MKACHHSTIKPWIAHILISSIEENPRIFTEASMYYDTKEICCPSTDEESGFLLSCKNQFRYWVQSSMFLPCYAHLIVLFSATWFWSWSTLFFMVIFSGRLTTWLTPAAALAATSPWWFTPAAALASTTTLATTAALATTTALATTATSPWRFAAALTTTFTLALASAPSPWAGATTRPASRTAASWARTTTCWTTTRPEILKCLG